MAESPRVSVIIATFNRAALVREAIDSVLDQSYRDRELIVVDDGSTDETPAVLDAYGSRLRRFSQANRERGAARNAGLRLARGEFAAFLDSDDRWLPDKLAREVSILDRRAEAVLAYCGARYAGEDGSPLGLVETPNWEGDVLRRIARRNFVSVGAHLLRRTEFLAAGGFSEDRALSGSEDWEAWVRLAARGPFVRSPGEGLLYRQHPGCTVADPQRMEGAMLAAHAAIFSNPELAGRIGDLRAPALARVRLVLASLCYAAGQDAASRRNLVQALHASPACAGSGPFWRVAVRALVGRRIGRRLRRMASPSPFDPGAGTRPDLSKP